MVVLQQRQRLLCLEAQTSLLAPDFLAMSPTNFYFIIYFIGLAYYKGKGYCVKIHYRVY
jgi:hypothetical protein